MSNMAVANEIRNQIGNKALYMIGAKNLVGSENKLSFKVMRNSKGVTHVTVTLTPMDVYNVRFTACRGTSIKEKGLVEGVYCDQLNKTIEEATGLYTHL